MMVEAAEVGSEGNYSQNLGAVYWSSARNSCWGRGGLWMHNRRVDSIDQKLTQLWSVLLGCCRLEPIKEYEREKLGLEMLLNGKLSIGSFHFNFGFWIEDQPFALLFDAFRLFCSILWLLVMFLLLRWKMSSEIEVHRKYNERRHPTNILIMILSAVDWGYVWLLILDQLKCQYTKCYMLWLLFVAIYFYQFVLLPESVFRDCNWTYSNTIFYYSFINWAY